MKFPSADFNRTQLERVITSFRTNLTAKAKQGKIDPVIGRGKEIEETIQFARRQKANVMLVGDPGVGKTAISRRTCSRSSPRQRNEFIKGATVYALDIGAMVAGSNLEVILKNVQRWLSSH